MQENDPQRVFFSWAQTGRDWPVDRIEEWKKTVVDFAYLLDQYVDVEADFFHYTEPGMDWTRYGPRSIEWAQTVLMVSSDPYWERWSGNNPPDTGAGVAREADVLHGLFNHDQRAFQLKAVIVVLPGETGRSIPHELDRVQRYPVPTISLDGIAPLLRRLLGIPEFRKCDRKQVPHLPVRSA